MAFTPRRHAPGTAPNKAMISIVTMGATIMQVLDTTIANVALPHMQGSLGATQDQIAWVLTSYLVAAAIATPVTAWLALQLGRTRLFTLALAGFTGASMLCGIGTTLPEMVLFRLMQGVFGAALVPLSQSILLDTYPRHEVGKAMGMFSMGVMVGPILGPIVGGYLTDQLSWRWCFYINVPLGIVAILGAIAFIPETTKATGRKLDWMGFGFLSLAVASLQLMLDRGEQKGWFESTEILVELALMAFGFYMFIAHSATTRRPFFDVRLFKDRTFLLSNVIMTLIMLVYYGSMALTPQMLQGELNYPVLTAGLVMAPRGIGTIMAILVVGRVSKWIDTRVLIGFGLALSALSLYLMSGWSLAVGPKEIILLGLLQGASIGFINVPLTTNAFTTLDADLRTEASGFYNLMRNIGSAAGISITSAILVSSAQVNHGYLTEYFTPFKPIPSLPGMSKDAAMAFLNADITRQAMMVSYINVFMMLAVLCVVIIPVVLFLHVPRFQPAGGAPHVIGE
ncbi:MAG TPA: DHA2 family efflux MFS transporter permease subunit [Alphaproteobacteria bacterium]|nr:DHA2 family efflux MFS transporter permease subunit [Alphaproteobacteria bacterium]